MTTQANHNIDQVSCDCKHLSLDTAEPVSDNHNLKFFSRSRGGTVTTGKRAAIFTMR